jgi:hypothetical protein
VVAERHDARETASESVSGKLVAYAVPDGILTLRTENGDRSFVVSPDTPLHQGVLEITAADLTAAHGCAAKVWYRAAEGQLQASEVRILCTVAAPEPPSRSH